MEKNENENTVVQNLWDTAKAILRGKFRAMQVYLRKQEKFQINNLTLHLKELEKEEQTKPKTIRRKEMIRAEINDTETKKTQVNRPMKPGAGSLKKSIKLIHQARLIKKKRERTQSQSQIREEK